MADEEWRAQAMADASRPRRTASPAPRQAPQPAAVAPDAAAAAELRERRRKEEKGEKKEKKEKKEKRGDRDPGPAPLEISPGVRCAFGVIFFQTVFGSMKGPFVATALSQGGVGLTALVTAVGALFCMVGSYVVSRCSDRYSRKTLLVVAWVSSVASNLTAVLFPNTLWPILPGVFAQFFGVVKALVGDFCVESEAGVADIGRWMATLNGVTSTASIMSPLVAVALFSDMWQVDCFTLAASLLVVGPILYIMPQPVTQTPEDGWSLSRMMRMEVWKSPGAWWMVTWLFFLAGGYTCFQTIMMPSLPTRFGAEAVSISQLQLFMAIGASFGTIFSGSVINRFCGAAQGSPVPLLALQTIGLFAFRAWAWTATEFSTVMMAYFFLMANVGVLNVLKSVLWTQLAPQDELGGVFGLQESIEGGLAPLVFTILTGVAEHSLGGDGVFKLLALMYVGLLVFTIYGYAAMVRPEILRIELERKAKAE